MVSSIFFLNHSGEVLIEKQFREKVPRSSLEDFWNTFMSPLRSVRDAAPVIQYSRFVFIQIRRGGVILLAIVTQECPPLMVMEMLGCIASVLLQYLKELTENTLRENFSIVYQLLEELVDDGYPLTTDLHVLDELVPQPTLENRVRSILDVPKNKSRTHGLQAVPWRNPRVKYSSNEVFFDIIEVVEAIVSAEGHVTHMGIHGSIEVNCRLSGMPDVLVHLQKPEVLNYAALHRCIKLERYAMDRVASFIPPDGRFTLLKYKCKPLPDIQPPFYVTPQVSFSATGGRINCMVGSRGGGKLGASPSMELTRITVNIPLPPCTEVFHVTTCTQGSHFFNKATGMLCWTVGNLGKLTPSLSGEFKFAAGAAKDGPTPYTGDTVTVDFQIPNVTLSGLRVESVTVLNEVAKSYKGVKYLTKAGRLCIRTV